MTPGDQETQIPASSSAGLVEVEAEQEAGAEARSLVPEGETREFFGNFCNQLQSAVTGNRPEGKPPAVRLFRADWNQEEVSDLPETDQQTLAELRTRVLGAIKTMQAKVRGQEGSVFQPAEQDNPFSNYEWEYGQDGEVKQGEVSLGQLILVQQMAVEEMEEGDLSASESARKDLNLMMARVDVLDSDGNRQPFTEFYNQQLVPKAQELAGDLYQGVFDQLPREKRQALLSRAEQELGASYSLVYQSEQEGEEPEAAETVSPETAPSSAEGEKIQRIEGLLAQAFGFEPESEKAKAFFRAFFRLIGEDGLTREKAKEEIEKLRRNRDRLNEGETPADLLARKAKAQGAAQELAPLLGIEGEVADLNAFREMVLGQLGLSAEEEEEFLLNKVWKRVKEAAGSERAWRIAYLLLEFVAGLTQTAAKEAAQAAES